MNPNTTPDFELIEDVYNTMGGAAVNIINAMGNEAEPQLIVLQLRDGSVARMAMLAPETMRELHATHETKAYINDLVREAFAGTGPLGTELAKADFAPDLIVHVAEAWITDLLVRDDESDADNIAVAFGKRQEGLVVTVHTKDGQRYVGLSPITGTGKDRRVTLQPIDPTAETLQGE